MSVLTKVFIVLLVVFSIAFTSMAIAIVAQTADWQDTALKYEEHARVADTNLRNLIAANAAELATARDTARGYIQRIGELQANLEKEEAKAKTAEARLDSAELDKSNSEAMNRALLAQLQATEETRAQYRTQRDELERRGIDLERRNIDLNDRVTELTAQIVVQLEQRRQFEQQINILQAENQKLARQARQPASGLAFEDPAGAAMPNVIALTPVAPAAVRGQIAEVSGNIVTISVGTADGVQKGMVFVIHREGQYVGDLKVDMVEPNQSAGRLVRSTMTPRPGDRVTDTLGLGGSNG